MVRNKDYGDFGNRIAVKASYKINDTFTPWCRVNYLTNSNNARWGGLGLENSMSGTEKYQFVRVEPMVSYSLGKGIGGYFGARINHNLTKGSEQQRPHRIRTPARNHRRFLRLDRRRPGADYPSQSGKQSSGVKTVARASSYVI